MAHWLLLLYPLLVLTLVALAIYEHVNTTALSVPISPALTILTICLPLLAVANAYTYPRLAPGKRGSALRALLPAALQLLQFALTTILATLFAADLSTQPCLLATRWQRLWSTHDARAIRAVQDALDCCGFNSVRDRAWPFPSRGGPPAVDCATRFGRTTPCAGPWGRTLRRTAGVEVAVVVAVGLLQLVSLLVQRQLRARQGGSWYAAFRDAASVGDREGSRPLLEGDEERRIEDAAGGGLDEDDEAGREQRGRENGYGSLGPRVEPSHHDPWAHEGGHA